jgi:two-component system, sensor histidine kinase and response regulator
MQNNLFTEKKPFILIVDDIPDNLEILEKILGIAGYITSTALSGERALSILKKEKPDLIILDILMPLMDGFEVCKKIKDNPETSDIPVIFITAMVGIDDIISGFKHGADDYIPKPFSSAEVLVRVNKHLELKFAKEKIVHYNEILNKKNKLLLISEEKLKKMNESKDKFFSILAHDMKNPFQGFMGLTELLTMDYDNLERDDILEIIQQMNKSAVDLYNLLENLLTWSRIQLGKVVFNPQPFLLHELIEEIIKQFKQIAFNKKITLENFVDSNYTIKADKYILKVIIENLISNGIKFSHPESIVKISSVNYENSYSISVEDSGIGITNEEMGKIYRLDNLNRKRGTQKETGSGMGLVICKELCDRTGAEISIKSKPGSGSIFSVNFQKVM